MFILLTIFQKKFPFIYRGLIPGLVNLLLCIGFSLAWESPFKGAFSLVLLVSPGMLFGFTLSLDMKNPIKAWSFILLGGLIFSISSILYMRYMLADDGSTAELWLACSLPGILILFLYKFLIDQGLHLFRAITTFLPISIMISLVPALAFYLGIIVDLGEVLSGVIIGIAIMLWQVALTLVCYKFSRSRDLGRRVVA